MEIRLLKADEIEVRVQSTNKTSRGVGCILLLYKDSRTDMRILDEVFGVTGWQRTHELINGNLFCNIDIWDKERKCWIRKQDVGTESNTEKEKGQASDSFKRAGFNIGIGRELYSSPFIYVSLESNEHYDDKQGKPKVNAALKFSVKSISYNDKREIEALEVADNHGKVRYTLKATGKPVSQSNPQTSNTTTETESEYIRAVTKPTQPVSEQKAQTITTAQAKRLFALSGGNADTVRMILNDYGYTSTKDIKTSDYDKISHDITEAVKGA